MFLVIFLYEGIKGVEVSRSPYILRVVYRVGDPLSSNFLVTKLPFLVISLNIWASLLCVFEISTLTASSASLNSEILASVSSTY